MENLLRPWLLARLVLGITSSLVALGMVVFAWRGLALLERNATTRSLTAPLVTLERRAELVSTAFSLLSLAAVLDLLLAVVGADRMSGSLRGAMCAYGVLHSTPWGVPSLVVSIATLVATAAWSTLHRIDLSQREPRLLATKLRAALVVAPFVVGSAIAATRHALALDFRVVASCCSSSLDRVSRTFEAHEGGPRDVVFALFVGASIAGAVVSLARGRRSGGGRWLGALSSSLGVLAVVTALPAIMWVVAPFAYETPVHLCPYCLLHGDVWGVGYALLVAWVWVLRHVLGVLLTTWLGARVREPAAVDELARHESIALGLSLSLTCCIALAPVVRYVALHHASVFGS